MTNLKDYINENVVNEAGGKIVGWYGVSVDNGSFIEVLGKICPRYAGETEEETKLRFVKERHEQSIEHIKSELRRVQQIEDTEGDGTNKSTIEMLKKYLSAPFNAEKSLQRYIFW